MEVFMKIRTDYVTNSSSSSFILSFTDEKDIKNFKEICEDMNYEMFLELIDNKCSDFITFYNDSKENILLNILIDKIIHYNFHEEFKLKLKEFKKQNIMLKKYESFTIKINDFGDIKTDLDKIGFEEIEEEDKFSINIINNKDNRNKNKMIDDLKRMYCFDYKYNLLKEKIDQSKYTDYREYLKAEREFEESEEFKNAIDNFLKTTDFEEQVEKINKSKLCIAGTIWDTSGGLIEWAIRNGFIEENFRRNCIICYNVG
jgi:hypothetical protein